MTPYIFALIAYIGWGAGVYFEAIVARKLSPVALLFWSLLFSCILATPLAILFRADAAGYTPVLLLANIILTFGFVGGGSLLYYQALRDDNRMLVGTIASSFPIVSVILSVSLFHERITTAMGAAMCLVFVGIILLGFDFQTLRNHKFILSRGVILALVTMLLWGTFYALVKLITEKVGWFFPNYVNFFMFPLLFLWLKFKHRPIRLPIGIPILVPLIASTILIRIAEFAYNYGVNTGKISVVAPISGANPTLFVLLAFLFLKDPLKKQQIFGIALALTGIVALGLTQ